MIRSGCDPAFHGAAKREVDLALSYRQFHSGQGRQSLLAIVSRRARCRRFYDGGLSLARSVRKAHGDHCTGDRFLGHEEYGVAGRLVPSGDRGFWCQPDEAVTGASVAI